MEDDAKLPTWVPRLFYRLLFLTGVLFYFSWLIVFGIERWNDVGVYSISVILIAFGLVGAYIYDEIEKKEQEEAEDINH